MFRRGLAAFAVLAVIGGFALAENYQGLITKVEDGKVTITVRKKGEKKGEEKTFKMAKDANIMNGAGKDKDPTSSTEKELKEAIEKGFTIKDKTTKGAFARIETEGEGDRKRSPRSPTAAARAARTRRRTTRRKTSDPPPGAGGQVTHHFPARLR